MKELLIILCMFQLGLSLGYVFEEQIERFVEFHKECFK